MTGDSIHPSAEYMRRLTSRRKAVERYETLNRLVSNARLTVAVVFFTMLWASLGPGVISRWWMVLPVIAFVGLIAFHEHAAQSGRRAARAAAFYERGLARMEDRWLGSGANTFSIEDEHHLYAADLDMFGKGSLFELLSTARTRSGEQTLAGWLCAPAQRDEILLRQEAVHELRSNIDLREDLAVLGPDVRAGVHAELMTRWGRAPAVFGSHAARILAPALAVLTLYALIDYLFFGGKGWIALGALGSEAVFGYYYQHRVREVIAAVEEPERELEILSVVLRRFEQERFTSAKLHALRSALQTSSKPPSHRIARLKLMIDLLNSRLNQFFAPVAYILLWSTQLAFAVEAWRRSCGPVLGQWLDAVGELEALCALAGYAYERPEDPFPEIVQDAVCLEAEEIRHPLLARDRCVPNSVRLGEELRLLVVSGSNMSGKSTLLRTLGVNAVLAFAGAPVRARRLRISIMAIGATLRVQDSLQGGTSRFYAEIRRLRDIMDLTQGPLPVLFLLDEILHGTNSHDRAIGAEAVVRGLVERGAIGLVTTHDLALAKVADALAPHAANVHFQDHLENGQMVFDYMLHPGVVQKSNALDLMRAVGLKV